MSIYQPSDDSYLLAESVKEYLEDKIKNKNIKKEINQEFKILDMGSGSGIQADTCISAGFKNVLAVDISKEVVDYLKYKKIKVVQSNLFSKIKKSKENKFDLIIFNPPYLPEDKNEPEDSKLQTTAGKKGYEIIIKFLKQAKSYLTKDGAILLLFSSFSQPKIIIKKAQDLGYSLNQLSNKKLFFEELFVYELKNKNNKK